MKPFDNKPREEKGRRTIRELPLDQRNLPPVTDEDISEEDLRNLYDFQSFVINKATAVLREVEPEARKLTVPVDIDAVRVRNAVRRQMGKGDGSAITFDLYKDSYDELVRRARKLKFEVVGEFTGDAHTDAMKIKRRLQSGGAGLSKWQEFLLNLEPWLLWLLLNQLIGQHQGIEHQEACAAKTPPATEVGPIQLRIAISMAAMMLILGMQEEHVLFAMNQPQFNFPLPGAEILAQARRQIEGDGMSRQLKEIQGATDPLVITQYADNYIARNSSGYEAWLAYRDLRDTREQVVRTYYHAHQYSEGHRVILDYDYRGTTSNPEQFDSFFNPLGVNRNIQVRSPSQSSMATAYYRSMVQGTTMADRSINAIAGVMTSGFALDVLCCFARFMIKSNDIGRLRKIRNLIALAYGASSGGISLTMMTPRGVLNWAIRGIQQEIIGYIHKTFDHVVDDVADWVLDIDPDLMEDLYYCPFIYDLVMLIQESIGFLQTQLFDLIRRFLTGFETTEGQTFVRWGTMYDLRRAGAILSILDKILATLEYCAKDDGGSGDGVDPIPDPGEDESFYDGVPRPLKLPPEVVEKFFSATAPIPRGEGQRPIPAPGTDISTQEEQVTVENYRKFCLGIVPNSLIDAVLNKENS